MLKLPRKVDGSCASALMTMAMVTTMVVTAVALGATGVASAAPTGSSVLSTRLRTHRLRKVHVHSSHARERLAHEAIVGGSQISIEQAPWQAELESTIPAEHGVWLVRCGGSILDAAHVLTAAHCVFDSQTSQRTPPVDMQVIAGTADLAAPAPAMQAVGVSSVRVHPYFDYEPGNRGTDEDDVAVLTLAEPLTLGGGGLTANALGLAPSGTVPLEGMQATLTGFGEQVANTEPDSMLYSLGMTVQASRSCGGADDAVFLCANAGVGSSCFGDSGSGLVGGTGGSGLALIGTLSFGLTSVREPSCHPGELHGFANLSAPEIQDFIGGSVAPPRAPRGGGPTLTGTPLAGSPLSCQPGSWSGEPTYAYEFIDSANGQVLQNSASSSYVPSGGDVGRMILCQVLATNAGGTGVDRSSVLSAVAPAPPPPPLELPAEPAVSIADVRIIVQGGAVALVKVLCTGQQECTGRLTLVAKRTLRKGRKRVSHEVAIGKGTLALEGGAETILKIDLSAVGRTLLRESHDNLAASLTILELTPDKSSPPRSESVRLLARGKASRLTKDRKKK